MNEALEIDWLLLRQKRLRIRGKLQEFVVPVVGHPSSRRV